MIIFAVMICKICPRQCGVDRVEGEGFCGAPERVEVAAVCRHTGEEPPLSGKRGICNVFFAHCNLQCVYCQNHEISRAEVPERLVRYGTVEEVRERIEEVMAECENMLGFVSPTQYAYVIPDIVEGLWKKGLRPTVVYNTNGYDSADTLRMVEPYVDVYLPDLKYIDDGLGERYSNVKDYVEVACGAIREMVRQKGSGLLTDDEGLAFRGVIIRHLVLPGQIENTKGVLEWIAENVPHNVHVSLMAQYYPLTGNVLPDELNRTVSKEEYEEVAAALETAGLKNGWLQEMDANANYHPDFNNDKPFNL